MRDYLDSLRKNPKEHLIRLVLLFLGLMIAHLGVTLFLLAELGSDPFNVMIQGLFRRITAAVDLPFLTHGRVHMAVSFLIILILLAVDSSYVKLGTLVCMFCGGPIIDLYELLLGGVINASLPLAVRIGINILGCAILACGMTLVIRSEAGTGPNDLVAVVISDKAKRRFSVVRVIVDVCFAGIGWLLGGTIGIGTVICAFVVGPVAGIFLPLSGRIVDNALRRFLPDREPEA